MWQRHNREIKLCEDKNSMIWCLNWMAGEATPSAEAGPESDMAPAVKSRVDGLARCQQPSEKMSEEAAFKLLLRCRDYSGLTAAANLASYQFGLVSFPEGDLNQCPMLSSLLGESDRQFLSEESERMIRQEPIDTISTEAYWDPKLRYNQKAYHKLVSFLDSLNYFYYTTSPKNSVGVFFVWKSNGTKLRMISDARLPNRAFKDPPPVKLLTGEGLGSSTLDSPT